MAVKKALIFLKRNAMTHFIIALTTVEQVQQNVITDTRKIIDFQISLADNWRVIKQMLKNVIRHKKCA